MSQILGVVAGFLWGGSASFCCFSKTLRAHITESNLPNTMVNNICQIFFSDYVDQMCKMSSKSGGGGGSVSTIGRFDME